MNHIHILYLYSEVGIPLLSQALSSRYSVQECCTKKQDIPININWDLVVLQDGAFNTLQKKIRQKLQKYPWLFVSNSTDIQGYMAVAPNLFGTINLSDADLTWVGIPEELQLHMQYPVEKK